MSNVTAIAKAIDEAGGVTRVAAIFGVPKQTIYCWRAGTRGFPAARCAELERYAQTVRRWHMRPTDWHLIWPELRGTKGAPRVSRAAA